ncbi:MAG: hypothetical protein K9H14_07575 [Actinomycetia bacterium]|nr:hypothetical protein [Actinomycetes bacterium]
MKINLKPVRYLKKFSLFDLVIMAIITALGIAVKPAIVPLVHILTGPCLFLEEP